MSVGCGSVASGLRHQILYENESLIAFCVVTLAVLAGTAITPTYKSSARKSSSWS
jgi:hypothetical protein